MIMLWLLFISLLVACLFIMQASKHSDIRRVPTNLEFKRNRGYFKPDNLSVQPFKTQDVWGRSAQFDPVGSRHPAVFIFLSKECKPCNTELPKIQTTQKEVSPSEHKWFFIINSQSSQAKIMFGGVPLPTGTVIAHNGNASELFRGLQVKSTPSFALVDRTGRVSVIGHTTLLRGFLKSMSSDFERS